MMIAGAGALQPLTLSLSKGCSWALGWDREEQGFDKLSLSGDGGSGPAYPPTAYPELVEGLFLSLGAGKGKSRASTGSA